MNQTHEEKFKDLMHDMRSPLAAILLCIDLLNKEKIGPLNKRQKELIDSVKESAEKLKVMLT